MQRAVKDRRAAVTTAAKKGQTYGLQPVFFSISF
jgi:hypothetical protein